MFQIGQYVKLRALITNKSTGSPVDPDTVTLTVIRPGGGQTLYRYPAGQPGYSDLTRDGVGDYYAAMTIDESGQWWYYFQGEGTAPCASQKDFLVRELVTA